MKNKSLIERLMETPRVKNLEKRLLSVEKQNQKLSEENIYLTRSLTRLANEIKKMRRGMYILNGKSNDVFEALESHNEPLEAFNFQAEQTFHNTQIIFQRLEAVEGYYFDKPLKEELPN